MSLGEGLLTSFIFYITDSSSIIFKQTFGILMPDLQV